MKDPIRGRDRFIEDRVVEEPGTPIKFTEVHSAILLVKNPTFRTSTTFTLWTLQHMFFPITLDDHEDMRFLHISERTPLHDKIPKDSFPDDDTRTNTQDKTKHTNYKSSSSPSSTAYILTPRSRLVAMANEYSMVFMVDLSSSLATVDVNKNQIMVGNIYDVIRNIIYGLVQPLSMQLPQKSREPFMPSICMSVIAECSQFGSNMNVVPILAEYPTMRVLLQNALVTPANLSQVLQLLQRGINQFQCDLVNFRKRLAKRRVNSGYELDVRNEHPAVDHGTDDLVDMTASSSTQDTTPTDEKDIKKKRNNSTKPDKISKPGSVQRATSMSEQHYRRLSKTRGTTARKDVWGVGKSGSSLSYILHAGSFALDLLPPAGHSSLFLLTDGVVNSSIQDEWIIRHLNKKGITCNIVHVGFGGGLSPASNFGFFPDVEVLRFLATATGGHYLHSDNMPDVRTLVDDNSGLITANYYQRKFLFKQVSLNRPMSLDRSHPWVGSPHPGVPEHLHTDQEAIQAASSNRFPWHPMSQPRPIETSLLRYQEYPLPSSIRHIIAARTRQGFWISSIALDKRRMARRTLSQENNLHKEWLFITLSLDWQPEIQIEYRIRTGLSTAWSLYLGNHSFLQPEAELLDSLNSPRVEILIRTTTMFSHMLQNWDVFQRRCQVMGIVTGGIGVGDSSGSSTGFLKIGRLKKFLSRIFETDQHLFSLLSRREDLMGQFRSLWDKLDQSDCRLHTFSWYDVSGFDLILLPQHQYSLPSSDETFEIVLQRLHDSLGRWADFCSSSDKVYVKMLVDCFTTTRQKSLSFCEVRALQENGRVVHIHIQFFNTRARVRRGITEDIKRLIIAEDDEDMYLNDLEVKTTSSESQSPEKALTAWSSNIKIANRPLSSLLMRDKEHYFYTAPSDKDRSITSLIRATTWRTGEFIVRNYLRRYTWHWETLVPGAEFIANNGLVSLQKIGFDRLCNARADQGYILISSREGACHFYKEFQSGDVLFSSQYYIWRDNKKGTLTTELWIEPITEEQVELQDDVYKGDKTILTKLVTFDWIFALGHDHEKCDHHHHHQVSLSTEDTLLNVYQVTKTKLFDIVSVLTNAAFSVVIYPCPNFTYDDYISDEVAWLEADKAPTPKTDTLSVASHEHRSSNTSSRDAAHRCSCPRPDKVFHDHSDRLASLPSVSRDIALLHYFFVRSMSIFADYEVPNDRGSSFSSYLDDILRSHAGDSTLLLSRDITDMQCFIKTFGPSTFIVVCVPSLDTILHNLKLQHQTNLSKFGLVMFECHRRLGGTGPSRVLIVDETTELVIKPMEDTLLDELACAIHPDLTNGSYSTDANLSDFRFRVVQSVSELYSRSFAKSVFTSLLYGGAVQLDDLDKVLEVCEETVLEIDLTGYLNVQSLLQRRGRSNLEEIQLAQQRFNTVLGHYFEPVVARGAHNLYCYRPPQTKLDSGKRSAQLTDIVVCAHSPLFLRLDYVLRNGKDGVEITFPLSQLPSSYQGVTADGKSYNFEPEFIGTATSPVGLVDNTAASLRMVCMTLPETSFDPVNILSSHLQGCPADNATHNQTSFLDSESEDREALLSLPADKQNALIETKMRLMWLLTEEIMHGLLRAGPVTESVVRYIESRLVKKNPFVDFPTTIVIPLIFVKDRALSLRKFNEQLEKNKTALYRLVRVGDCFYASDSGFFRSDYDSLVARGNDDAAIIDEYDEGLGISTYNTADRNGLQQQQQQASSGGHDDFCEGLGISIFEPAYPEEDEAEDQAQLAHQQLYWLLVIPHSNSVHIYFYSKMPQSVNRTEIIRVTKAMINELLDRTNKLVLLDYMNETRICSKYLIPADETYRFSSDDSSDDDADRKSSGDNLVDILSTSGEDAPYAPPKKFYPGQFGCETLYVHRYPLHWRLQPNTALNVLATDVMRHFAVRNRQNTFVCMQNGVVVYCTLHENAYTQYDSETQTIDDTTRASSPFGSSSLFTPYDNVVFTHARGQSANGGPTTATATVSSQRTSPKTTSPSRISEAQQVSPSTRKISRLNEARELVLEVHGVELPSWITVELVEMLGNRITNHITLKEVQQFLVRNPNSRLSRADVEFILPVEKQPSLQATLRFPKSIRDTTDFLHLLRESILSSGPLRVLNGNSLALSLRRHRQLHYYTSQRRESTFSVEEFPTELCFYYNCANRAPGVCTEFELSVGEGVAGIVLLLCDKDALPDSFMANVVDDNEVFEKAVTYEQSTTDQYITIDIWTSGQIEAQQLYNHLYNAFRQATCDYVIEASVMDASVAGNVCIANTVKPLIQVLQKAKEWDSPTVNIVSELHELQPWCLSNIIQQLSAEFSEIHLDLRPFVRQVNGYQLCNIMTPATTSRSSIGHSESLQESKEYVVISGLIELWGKEEEPLQLQHQQLQQLQYLDAPHRQEAHSVHSRHDSLTSSVGRAKDAQHRRCFLILFLDADSFTLYTYNYSKPFVDQIAQRIVRTTAQQDARIRSLSNILHQKMGLFHHSEHIHQEEEEVRQQKPELYTAVRLTSYNNVLRDAYAEPSSHPDHLVRHGDPFLETYFRGSQLRAAHEKAFKVYTKWASRYTTHSPVPHPSQMMTVTELKLILKTSRLLHFCRTPLMFSDGGSFDVVGAPVTGIFGDLNHADVRSGRITAWYQRLAQTFMNDYATYLESIGMHLIVNGASNGGDNGEEELEKYVSSFKITDDCVVSSPVVYLLQVFPGGTIMCEVQLTDIFASVTLYTLHRRYGRLTRTPYTTEARDAARASFQSFTEESDRVKQKIYVNSFVYDFRLRFIQQSLDDIGSLPDTLHLLNVIKSIVSAYQKLPSFALNRIVSKVHDIAIDDEHLDNVVSTLFRDARKYGFESICFDGKPIACFVSADDLSFDMAPPQQGSQARYTLVLAPLNAQESMSRQASALDDYQHQRHDHHPHGRPRLQFFVIITHQGWPSVRQYPPVLFEDLLEPAGASYALHSVVQPAIRRIDRLVAEVIHALHQDAAWNRLYRAIVNKSECSDSAETLVALSTRFYELQDVPILQPFIDHLVDTRWHDILEKLRLFYPQTSGYIQYKSVKYLLVFNSTAVLNYFVRFELSMADTRLIKITASSKEKRRDAHRLDETEMSFIDNLALTLSYCIWKISH